MFSLAPCGGKAARGLPLTHRSRKRCRVRLFALAAEVAATACLVRVAATSRRLRAGSTASASVHLSIVAHPRLRPVIVGISVDRSRAQCVARARCRHHWSAGSIGRSGSGHIAGAAREGLAHGRTIEVVTVGIAGVHAEAIAEALQLTGR